MPNLTLVVMAAGIGSRFGGLKQIEAVGPSGEAILDYSIYDALAAGFNKVVFVIRRDIEADFRSVLGARIEKQIDTRYVFQELDVLPEGFDLPPERKKPWGTGHAVLCCQSEVAEPFAVINADDFYGACSYAVLANHMRTIDDEAKPAQFCMAGFILGNTLSEHGYVSRGVCNVSDVGELVDIRELTHIEIREAGIQHTEDDSVSWQDLAPTAVASMNMWGFGPRFFGELEARFVPFLRQSIALPKSEFFLPSVVMELLSEGKAKVQVIPTEERWVGVTHKEDLAGVRTAIGRLIEQDLYPKALWK